MSIFWSETSDLFHFVPTMLNFKSLFPANTYSNITLGDENNKRLLDNVIAVMSKSLNNNKINGISWPQQNDEIFFPALLGVPSNEILNIRQKERDAFEKYRYYTQKKLLEMRAVVGTKDYKELVKSFQIEQKSQVVEISLLYKNIKSNLQRKITHHLSSILLSASATILAATSTNTNPIALLGVGIGSSGTAIGIEKIIEDWISFQSEKDKLKEKDSYILWRINQEQQK